MVKTTVKQKGTGSGQINSILQQVKLSSKHYDEYILQFMIDQYFKASITVVDIY